MINPIVFRAYDIRGDVNVDITTDLAYKLGFCFAKMHIISDNKVICIGRDGRLSSNKLYHALVQGVIDAGGNVISVDLVPSPILYFADIILAPAASIMITGSHNPKDDNGFKMIVKSSPFFGDQIQDLFNAINSNNYGQSSYDRQAINGNRNTRIIDIYEQYINRILDGSTIKSSLRIAWDPANGVACKAIALLANRLPNYNIIINDRIDGNFPHHHPDPTVPENLTQLINIVRQESYDCGIAFDGDADRIGLVTKTGRIVSGDQLLCLFAKEILEQNPGATIIMDIKSSQVVFEQIALYGGRPIMWKSGHSFIKKKMHEIGALFAGELSGHLFFNDRYYGYDDAIYAAIRLLTLLSKSCYSLDEMLDQLPQAYSTPEIRIPTNSAAIKFLIIDQIKARLTKNNVSFNDIDGIRVSNDLGWWIIRASNTEEAITIRCEASSHDELLTLKSNIASLLTEFEISCDLLV